METAFTLGLLVVLCAGLLGGYLAKLAKLQPVIGYILAGVVLGNLLPVKDLGVEKLAELGTILLLFSIGLEFSLNKFRGMFGRIFLASFMQIVIALVLMFLFFVWLNLPFATALVLSMGFTLSSTSVVIKILADRAELDSIHGKIMLGWLLVQDLAVVPMMILLPFINGVDGNVLQEISVAMLKSGVLVITAVILGKHVVPFIIHKVSQTNSRELLLLTSVCLAIGTAYFVGLLGISATLGAFLAGLVISESQENHAIFAETRPLKDIFVALFFVSLGLFVDLGVVFRQVPVVIVLVAAILIIKSAVSLVVSVLAGFRGKTAVTTSLGLAQVGEFAFVLFSTSVLLGIITAEISSVAISASLITLVITPFLFRIIIPVWRRLRFIKALSSGITPTTEVEEMSNHIVICGYGRVGGWVGKALEVHKIPFIVIEYDHSIVANLKAKGVPVVYGDPAEREVLDAANISSARAVVVAIPDRFAQESLITYVQTVAPNAKIISRVHLDEDWDRLKSLQVDKLVQPEFEAATEILKSILRSLGRDRESVKASIKNLRLSHSRI